MRFQSIRVTFKFSCIVICHCKLKKEALQNFWFLTSTIIDSILNFSSPSPLFKRATSSAYCREFNSLQDRVIKFLGKKCLVVLFY